MQLWSWGSVSLLHPDDGRMVLDVVRLSHFLLFLDRPAFLHYWIWHLGPTSSYNLTLRSQDGSVQFFLGHCLESQPILHFDKENSRVGPQGPWTEIYLGLTPGTQRPKSWQRMRRTSEQHWQMGMLWGSTKEVSMSREKGWEGFPGTVGGDQALLTVLNLVELRKGLQNSHKSVLWLSRHEDMEESALGWSFSVRVRLGGRCAKGQISHWWMGVPFPPENLSSKTQDRKYIKKFWLFMWWEVCPLLLPSFLMTT